MKTWIIAVIAAVCVLGAAGLYFCPRFSERTAETTEDCAACIGSAALASDAPTGSAPAPDTALAPVAPEATDQIIVYYFHTNQRCPSCLKIEKLTNEAVHQYFGAELASGKMAWRPTNTEDEVHAHFVKDFKLFTKSVVLVELQHGVQARWKNLDKIWTLLRDEDAFRTYIRTEVQGFMGSKS